MVHEKRIEIRWRDCDSYAHVNNAVYATYLEECRDEWLEAALGGDGSAWDYVLARVAIDFRRELVLDDRRSSFASGSPRIGTSSLTLREEVMKLDGTVSAEAEAVVVARDRETGRSRPLTDDRESSCLPRRVPILTSNDARLSARILTARSNTSAGGTLRCTSPSFRPRSAT